VVDGFSIFLTNFLDWDPFVCTAIFLIMAEQLCGGIFSGWSDEEISGSESFRSARSDPMDQSGMDASNSPPPASLNPVHPVSH
jgi:hypothetical protein